MLKRFMLVLCILMAASVAALAQKQAPPQGGPPKPFVLPAMQTFQLPNGMKVTMIPYGAVPKVTISAVIRAGNINEAENQVWLADLTTALMKEGTKTRSAAQVAEQAASMGGRVNIGTASDTTQASIDVLSEFGPGAVALLADVLQNPLLPASEVPRLKQNLLRNLSIQKSQPQPLAQERFAKVLYPNHPYGRYFPTPEMLQKFTVEDTQRFYKDNFGAARTHLYVAGQFNAVAMKKAITDAFAGWVKGPDAIVNIPKVEPQHTLELVDRPGASQSTLAIGLPVVDPSNPDYIPLTVMDSLLGGSFGSRITANIREQKGYTYSPYSAINVHYRTAAWAEAADVTTAVTGASIKEIFYEIDRLQKEPPTAAELDAIKNYMAGVFVLQNSSRAGVLNQVNFVDQHGLGDKYLETYVQKVHAVTPAQVQELAKKYLPVDKMTVVIVGDREKITDQIAPYRPAHGK